MLLRIQTISYKKLNDFSYIYLTGGKKLKDDKIYGLIQKDVAAGIAIKNRDHLSREFYYQMRSVNSHICWKR